MRPPDLTAPHALSPELLRALLRPRDELKLSPFVASGAPPRCHSSVTGEHRLDLQWVRCKLDETIEQPCSDFLAHTLEVCKSARRYNEYLAIQG
jgi:hypothetical protein